MQKQMQVPVRGKFHWFRDSVFLKSKSYQMWAHNSRERKNKKRKTYQDTRNKLPWVRVSSKKKKSLDIRIFRVNIFFKWSCRAGLKQDGRLSVSSYQGMKIDDYNCKAELALTSDVRTIICYRPSVDIPYEHTKLQVKTSFFLLLPAYPSAGSCAYS